ncbi:MAG: response regulator [Spirochaetaceae bacterium]|nr:response regulator [Spirochaetaceae bacterium]
MAVKKNIQPLILAVDDDSIIRIHVKSSLKSDYQIVPMATVKEALVFLDSNDVDLIILDLDMPEMSGFDMYEKIKQKGKTKNVPVIFLTGVEDDDIIDIEKR